MAGQKKVMSSEAAEFRSIFDATYPKVLAYARRRASAGAADDIVAETFLVAWRRRRLVLALDNPLPWLYTVAGNQLRNQSRGAGRHLRLVAKVAGDEQVAGEADNPPDEPDQAADRIHDGLAQLSFDDQEVLRLVAWEELSYAEAAEVLDCSVDAFAQRLRRAKNRLRQAMDGSASTPKTASDQENDPSPLTIAEVK